MNKTRLAMESTMAIAKEVVKGGGDKVEMVNVLRQEAKVTYITARKYINLALNGISISDNRGRRRFSDNYISYDPATLKVVATSSARKYLSGNVVTLRQYKLMIGEAKYEKLPD